MWSNSSSVHQDPIWGTYINNLDEEAKAVDEGRAFAALLDKVALIKAEGEDAESFLQGQTTCDFSAISQQQPKLGAHLNVKGRAQCTFVAFKVENSFYLLLPADQLEPTLAALSKYAVFSKVSLSSCQDYLVIGFGGEGIEQCMEFLFECCPEPGKLAITAQGAVMHVQQLGYLAVVEANQQQSIFTQLQQQPLTLCGDNGWVLHRINSGAPLISAALSELWIPQELNYELIDGVSFDKGCYKGQEIVARIHYRGQPKVRTQILSIETATAGDETVNLGDKISGEGQTGSIVEIARVNKNTLKVLSTLKTTVSESEKLKLEQNDESQIRMLPLPYAIT